MIYPLKSQVHLFADDCLFCRTIETEQDRHQLQADLVALEEWARKWGMHFMPKKCNVLRVSRSSKPYTYFYQLCNTVLKKVPESMYLGVTISDDLN